jgi:ABC-2 type transport system permease protein
MPLVMIFIYGYAISYDLNNINIAVVNNSKGKLSQDFINAFKNNGYFTIINSMHSGKSKSSTSIPTYEQWLREGKISEIIVIPVDFDKKIKTGIPTKVNFIIDGSDSNSANIIYQYSEQILLNFINSYQGLDKILKINTKVYFNTEAKSSFFFIPGLIAVLLLMMSALLTSLSISKEKESGSIELLFISPLKSFEIIIGKTIAYIFVAFAVEIIILLFSRFWFHIPIRGNLLILFIFSLIYIITGLAIGIFISTAAPDQKTAMLATLLATMLPSIMLSGFIFPLDSLSPILQYISKIIPATYFLKIIRGVVLKNASVSDLYYEGFLLILMAVVILGIATIKFSKERNKTK